MDGSLDAAQRERHEAELGQNPEAAAEVKALNALRDAVKRAVTSSVSVPVPRRRPFRFIPLVAGAVAVLAIAVAVIPRPEPPTVLSPDAMRFDTSAVMAKSPRAATLSASLAWVQSEIGYQVPDIDLGSKAKFTGAMHGGDWACFDFTEDGQTYHLYVRENAPQLDMGAPVKLDCEGEFYEGQGIGWKANGLSYYLKGSGSRALKRIAAQIAPQTSRA
ncbi:MAG: anti-sigma factor [Fimbriimonadaceae bacterium]